MKYAVCTGSFDPPTLGHLDIIKRAAGLFDRVYVAVLVNPGKKYSFTPAERCDMITKMACAAGLDNVFAEAYEGLAAEFAERKGAAAIVRGVRNSTDMAYEEAMEGANKYLVPGIETIYLAARPELAFISSSAVKEIASHKKDIDGLVPDAIKRIIAERLIDR